MNINEVYRTFNGIKDRIADEILQVENKSQIASIRNEISSKLDILVEENNSKIPSHVMKYYKEQIQSLNDQLDIKSRSFKKKFNFRDRKLLVINKVENDFGDNDEKLQKENDKLLEELKKENQTIVENKNNELIKIINPDLNYLSIKNIKNSILIIQSTSNHNNSSIHLVNCSNSIIKVEINGPIMIHNCAKLKLIIKKCHQLRIHDSVDSIISETENVESKEIILENCHDLVMENNRKEDDTKINDFSNPNSQEEKMNYVKKVYAKDDDDHRWMDDEHKLQEKLKRLAIV